MKYITVINGTRFEIDIQPDGRLMVNGQPREVDFLSLGPSLYSIIMNNQSYEVVIDQPPGDQKAVEVLMRGHLYTGEVLDERAQLLAMRRGGVDAESGEVTLKSPMPGLIVAITVAEGDSVQAGQTIIILESMKMQNELKAPRDGVIQRIAVQVGQSVEQSKPLITLA